MHFFEADWDFEVRTNRLVGFAQGISISEAYLTASMLKVSLKGSQR
jgi:hypothetical protein